MLINILETINEIETSLTFCKSNKLHSSIINMEDLKTLISKTNTNLNFWELSSQISSYCRINNDQIEYLLEIPIYENKNLPLIQITPVPVIQTGKMYLINEEKVTIIKDDNKLYHSHYCLHTDNKYYCKSNYVEINNCLQQIVNYQNNKFCNYHEINEVFLLFRIENSNLMYIVSPEQKTIKIKCKNEEIRKSILGIYKFEINDSCQLNNYTLERKLIKTKEIIFENFDFQIKSDQMSNKTLYLKQVNKQNIVIHETSKIDVIKPNTHSIVNTFVIIIILMTITIIVLVKFFINIKKKHNLDNENLEMETKLNPIPVKL